jgi:membrane protein DedA with SNARE-associated domain
MTFSPLAAVLSLVTSILSTVGLPGLFALMAVESFGIPPLPSEVILPFAGFLIAEGIYPLAPAILVALIGGLVGAYIAYAVGRWGRDRITHLGIGRLRVDPSHLDRMDRFFARRGELTVAVARLVPVVRSYVSYPAGTARMNPVKFGAYTLLGSTPFALGLIYAGIVLGANWNRVTQDLQTFDLVFLALVIAGIVYFALIVVGVVRPKWLAPSPAPSEPPSRAPPPASP